MLSIGNCISILFIFSIRNVGLTALPWGIPSVWTFVSDEISLSLTSKDLGSKKFFFYEIEHTSFYSGFVYFHEDAVSPCLIVFFFFISKRVDASCSLFAWTFLAAASRGERWSIVVFWLCLHNVVLALFPSGQRSPTILFLPFYPLLYLEHLLEQSVDNLKGLLIIFQVLLWVLLWTLTLFRGIFLAATFCCTEQRETLNLLVEGISTLHCGPCPGQEQFLVVWIAWVFSIFEKGLLKFFLLVCFTYKVFCSSFCLNIKWWRRNFVEKIVPRERRLFFWQCFCCHYNVLHWLQGFLLFLIFAFQLSHPIPGLIYSSIAIERAVKFFLVFLLFFGFTFEFC